MPSFPAVTSRIRLFRAARVLALGACLLGAAESCTSIKDDEPAVPSQPGAVQPDTTGKSLTEASACSELDTAESKARSDLGCASAKHLCPDYIRPAGGAGCFSYDQGSVTACVKLYGTFESCDDFDVHPCLITAVSECENGGSAGAAGMSGEGGMGGAPALDAAGSGGAPVDNAAGAGG
jgi:hypothetical protein